MASVDVRPVGAQVERRLLDKANWGALFAGFFVGMGLLFLLLSLGAAIGLTSVDPRDFGAWRTAGIGVGIWGGLSAIAASFGSAWVAGRMSTSLDRVSGMLHGVVLWGLTWAVVLWLGAMLVSSAVGGAVRAAGTAMQSAATASGGQVTEQDAQQAAREAREEVAGAAGEAQQKVEEYVQVGAVAPWSVFLAALFTLLASAIGGAAGVPPRAKASEPVPARPVVPQRA
jgi:hypothetical protein